VFLFSETSSLALRPTQTFVPCEPGFLIRAKAARSWCWPLPQSKADFKTDWSYTCFLALHLRGVECDDFISLDIGDSASTVLREFDDDVATRMKFEENSNYLLPVLSVPLTFKRRKVIC